MRHLSYKVYVAKGALQFPSGADTNTIPQAKRNARWLAEFLTKRIGETVAVEPLVVLPGWYVENKEPPSSRAEVMTTKVLFSHLAEQSAKIPEPQVRRIVNAIDEKCRDVEF